MNIYLMLFLIAFIIVNIIDISGFIQTIEQLIAKKWKVNTERVHIPKPFSCSYCMTHHIGLIVLIFTGQLTLLTYAYLVLVAYFTPIIASILYWMNELVIWLLKWLNYPLEKL